MSKRIKGIILIALGILLVWDAMAYCYSTDFYWCTKYDSEEVVHIIFGLIVLFIGLAFLTPLLSRIFFKITDPLRRFIDAKVKNRNVLLIALLFFFGSILFANLTGRYLEKTADLLRIKELEKTFPLLESNRIIHYLRWDECVQFVYLNREVKVKPGNVDCLNSTNSEFTEKEYFIEQVLEGFLKNPQIKDLDISRIHVTFDEESKLQAATFYRQKINHFSPVGYVYMPDRFIGPLDRDYLKPIDENWSSIGYHPSPF